MNLDLPELVTTISSSALKISQDISEEVEPLQLHGVLFLMIIPRVHIISFQDTTEKVETKLVRKAL
jgi:hypothetical protein